MLNSTPARKVVGGGLAATLTTLLIWVVETFSGIEIPQMVEGAILTVLVFLVGYFVPPSKNDQIVIP